MENKSDKHKKKRIIACIIGMVALLALVAGVAACANRETPTEPVEEAEIEEATDAEEIQEQFALELGVKADAWDKETSTPVIAHIESIDSKTDFYHAYNANESHTLEIDEGTYTVSFISPINADGSMYEVPEPAEIDTIVVDDEIDEDAEDSELPFIFKRVAAEDTDAEMLDKVLADIELALKNGDETLPTSIADALVTRAEKNAKGEGAIEEEAKDSVAKDEKTAEDVKTKADKQNNNNQSAGKQAGNTNANNTSNKSSSGSGSKSNGKSSSGSQKSSNSSGGSSKSNSSSSSNKPAHTHNWVAQTKQVWVQDKAAYTEKKRTGSYIQCSCGATFSSNAEWGEHDKEIALAGGKGHSFSVEDKYEEIYHDAVGHYETKTTGYVCSGCGATK